MYYTITTQGGDKISTFAGDDLATNHFNIYGGGKGVGAGNVYENVQYLVSGDNLTWYIQYYLNGVRQKPPQGGGVVSGHAQDVTVWTPTSYYLITQNGDYLVTQLGERIKTQLYYPMGAGFVSGFGVLGVVFRLEFPVYGGAVIKLDHVMVTPVWANWLITSHIGSMNFTHDDTGEVVKMVMPWYNWIYAMRKIGNSGVVVYGENGVVLLTPRGTSWGTRNITQVGIKGKLAVCTNQDDTQHYFIDEQGFFWHIVEGQPAKRTDFSNYFNVMNENTVMTWDYKNDIIYICDGVRGYIWTKDGLGQGPATISGLGIRWGEDLFVVGPSAVAPAPFQVCTDIMDFGNRQEKTIHQVDLGVSLPVTSQPILDQDGNYIYDQDGYIMFSQLSQNDIYVAIDYRWESSSVFVTSPWVKADNQGQAFFMATGVEFRIRVKLLTYENIQLDYANIRVIHDDLKPLGMAS